MRLLRKAIIIGFAALGAYKAWELLSPKVGKARAKTADARDRVEPALRDAADTVRTASRDAVASVADASFGAAASVADASVGAAESVGQAVVDISDEDEEVSSPPAR
jgi:hypothetical protein